MRRAAHPSGFAGAGFSATKYQCLSHARGGREGTASSEAVLVKAPAEHAVTHLSIHCILGDIPFWAGVLEHLLFSRYPSPESYHSQQMTAQGGHSQPVIDSGLVGSTDLSGRGTARAEDAQGTPTQSHIPPSIRVYEDK